MSVINMQVFSKRLMQAILLPMISIIWHHALIRLHGQENNLAYITRRIDRIGNKNPSLLAMEDFCQLDGRLSQDKYRGSYERCAKIIKR